MPELPNWYDYYRTLPSGLPDVAYDAQREAFFDQNVRPWAVQQGFNPETAKQEFLEKTPRPDKSPMPRAELVVRTATRALIDPLAGAAGQRDVQEFLRQKESESSVEAERQGISPLPYQLLGEIGGQAPYWYGGAKLAGMTAQAASAPANLELTRKIFTTISEGAVQAAYDGAKAEDGHRAIEAAEGAAIGAGLAGAVEFAGPLWKVIRGKHAFGDDVAQAIEASARGVADETQAAKAAAAIEADPTVVQTVGEVAAAQVKAGKRRGKAKAAVATTQGEGVVAEVMVPGAAQPMPITLEPKDIGQASAIFDELLVKGGSIEGLSGDPSYVNELLRQVDNGAVKAGLYDIELELGGMPAATLQMEEVGKEVVEEVVEKAPEVISEALPVNPLVTSLRKVLLDPKLTEAQKSASRVRLQKLSPETLQEIDALQMKPAAGAGIVDTPPTTPGTQALPVDEEDPAVTLMKMREASRKKAEAEGVLQPSGRRLGLEDVSEYDHLEMLPSGKVRDKIKGKIYNSPDEALRAKGLAVPKFEASSDSRFKKGYLAPSEVGAAGSAGKFWIDFEPKNRTAGGAPDRWSHMFTDPYAAFSAAKAGGKEFKVVDDLGREIINSETPEDGLQYLMENYGQRGMKFEAGGPEDPARRSFLKKAAGALGGAALPKGALGPEEATKLQAALKGAEGGSKAAVSIINELLEGLGTLKSISKEGLTFNDRGKQIFRTVRTVKSYIDVFGSEGAPMARAVSLLESLASTKGGNKAALIEELRTTKVSEFLRALRSNYVDYIQFPDYANDVPPEVRKVLELLDEADPVLRSFTNEDKTTLGDLLNASSPEAALKTIEAKVTKQKEAYWKKQEALQSSSRELTQATRKKLAEEKLSQQRSGTVTPGMELQRTPEWELGPYGPGQFQRASKMRYAAGDEMTLGYWIGPEGKAIRVGEHDIFARKQTGISRETDEAALDTGEGYLSVSKLTNAGWVRTRDNNLQIPKNATTAAIDKGWETAANAAKRLKQKSVWVDLAGKGGEVPLAEAGEFLANPRKYVQRAAKMSYEAGDDLPSREAKGILKGKEVDEWKGERHAWVDNKGKVHVVDDHTVSAEQLLKAKSYYRDSPVFDALSKGYIRLNGPAIEMHFDGMKAIRESHLRKAVEFAVDEAKTDKFDYFVVHINQGLEESFGSAKIPLAEAEDFIKNPLRAVRRNEFGWSRDRRLNPDKYAAGAGAARSVEPTKISERPLQTRITGKLAEQMLPSSANAGTLAPKGTKPTIYYRNPNKTNIHHEFTHALIGNLGMTGYLDTLVRTHPIGSKMLDAFDPQLRKLYGQTWPEEAYVYATSYLRTGKEEQFQRFIDADGDRAGVLKWLADTTDDLLKGVAARPESQHKLVAERRFRDILRRTTGELDTIARDTVSLVGDELGFEGGKYVVTKRDGARHLFDTRNSLLSFLEKNYEQPLSSPSLVDESLLPSDLPRFAVDTPPHSLGRAPLNTTPPSPEVMAAVKEGPAGPPAGKVKGGIQGLSYWTRPFYAWLDTVARKNEWPELYTKFKALDLAQVERDNFRGKYDQVLVDVFRGVKPARRSDFYRYLEADEAGKAKLKEDLLFTEGELARLGKLRTEFYDPLAAEFGVSADMYLQNYAPRIRAANLDPDAVKPDSKLTPEAVDFFAKHVRTGELDPREMDLLKVSDTYLRLGARKKHMETALEEAAELVNMKTPSGEFVTGSLQPLLKRHIENIRGIPDYSSTLIDSAANSVKESINDFIAGYNKKVPKSLQLEEIEATPRDVMSKFILFQYAGSMGLRPIVPFRDSLQTWITGYPILGGKYLAKGTERAMRKGAYEEAREAGALMWDNPMKSLYAESTESAAGGKAVEVAEKMLWPLKVANNVSRLPNFWGHQMRAEDAIKEFYSHRDVQKLVRDSALTWTDETLQKNFVKEIAESTPAQSYVLSKRIAKELVDVAHWNYRAGAAPGIYKYTMGRLFGQYGTWPLNYIEYVRRLASNPDRQEARKALTRLAIAHSSIMAAGNAAGVDTAQWVFTQPMAYTGGPLMQAVVNIPGTMDFETYRGDQARRQVVRPIWPGSIPGGNALLRAHDAIASDDPDIYKILLGLQPLEGKDSEKWYHQIP